MNLLDYCPPPKKHPPHDIVARLAEIEKQGIRKNGLHIQVDGYILSPLARDYYNVSFFGHIQARDNLCEEPVLGCFEINKDTGFVSERNIRLTRFLSRPTHQRKLVEFFYQGQVWALEQNQKKRQVFIPV